MTDLPLVCTLSPAAIEIRQQNLLNALVQRAIEHVELPNGYRLRFAAEGDIIREIAQVIDAERRCCRFLQFTLTAEPDAGPITLDLIGPPGTRDFLMALFDQR
jgi:hypothetical protein